MIVKKLLVILSSIALLALSYSAETHAKYTKRGDKWEASFMALNSLSTEVNGENESFAALDSDMGWGLTLGYNLNTHVLVNFQFTSTSPKYDATLIDEDSGDSFNINHKMNVYNSQFNVVYNFMADQFTPFVQAGAGWSYLDSNIADGPPNSFCWWHPFWGYICESYQDTHDDTRFSYNVAAGFRYELDNSLFFRASYQQNWTSLSSSDDLSMGVILLEVGSIF